MMKRLITLFIVTFIVCATTWADSEFEITLDKGDVNGYTEELGYANITFRLVEYGAYHWVIVTIENTTMSEAILLFNSNRDEQSLKKNKPKIEFEKSYPGKGQRSVLGCSKGVLQPLISIIPAEKKELYGFDVSLRTTTDFVLPIYLAKYDSKKLSKKGTYGVNYKILSEDILDFKINIKGWDEQDPEYVSTKASVDEFVHWVNAAAFCKNPKHKPGLDQQMKPYQEKKDSLINVINATLEEHHDDWYSTDTPHIKYTELLTQLNDVNLNDHTYDCGKHKVVQTHSCGLCSLSAQQIYHQLDDIYQQLRVGKLTKEAAVKKAQSLNNCYQKNNKRKKDPTYSEKISKFYSSIINY